MPWVRKDDQMPIHRKVAPLSDAAYRLYDEALCWSSRNLTDGVIRADELEGVSNRGRPRLAAELVKRGLWHEAGGQCPSEVCPPAGPDGWVIHDYWDYQPSKETVLKERAAAAERQRRKRAKDGTYVASGPRHGVTDGVTNAVSNAPGHGGVTPPPARTRPEGTGKGLLRTHEGDVRTAREAEPPSKCPEHEHLADPPPCGRCADARRNHDRWEAARNARQAAAPKCRTHRGQLAHNCALCRAEQLAAIPPEGAP